MSADIQFELSNAAIDAPSLTAALQDPAIGAVVTFEGRIRDRNAGRKVVSLEYQAYPELARITGVEILTTEAARWEVLAIHAVHRTGMLAVGEIAVWVGIASMHRGPAFDAARAVMERLKFELPVWKKETYEDGESAWVGADNTPPETGVKSGG